MTLDSPVFVVGCPRSGTTLLSVLLDRHSELAMTPETAFYDEIAPVMFSAGPNALRALLAGWSRLPELGLSADEVLERLPERPSRARLLGAVLAGYGAQRGKRYCGEKTPQHLWHVPQILNDFPGARVICMVRDGRDVALSLAAMPWWKEGLEAAAQMWLAAHHRRLIYEANYGQRFLSLRYEDLAAAPGPALKQVMAFLGLRFEPGQLEVKQASGVVLERTRAWKAQALGPVDPECGGRRRLTSGRGDLALLDAMLGEALVGAGYPAETADA
jgi:hypothetical protein